MSDTLEEPMRITVWNYFERCNDDLYKAKCLLCHKIFSCSTSANLRHHLQCIHYDEVDLTSLKPKPRKNKSTPRGTKNFLHKYFTVVEGDKLAMCKRCHKILSYRTTVGNLKTHLTRFHHDEYSESNEYVKSEFTDNEEDTYSEGVDDEYSSVTFTEKFNDRKLKRLYSNSDDGKDYTEVIYLENEEPLPEPKRKSNKSLSNESIKHETKNKRILKMTTHDESDRLFEKGKDVLKNNELANFGQYVASLLGSLPKHVSTKLQMSIINQIMEEKLKIESLDNTHTTMPEISPDILKSGL